MSDTRCLSLPFKHLQDPARRYLSLYVLPLPLHMCSTLAFPHIHVSYSGVRCFHSYCFHQALSFSSCQNPTQSLSKTHFLLNLSPSLLSQNFTHQASSPRPLLRNLNLMALGCNYSCLSPAQDCLQEYSWFIFVSPLQIAYGKCSVNACLLPFQMELCYYFCESKQTFQ